MVFLLSMTPWLQTSQTTFESLIRYFVIVFIIFTGLTDTVFFFWKCDSAVPNSFKEVIFMWLLQVAAYYVNTPWPESGEDNLEGDANQLPADYTPQHKAPDPWHRNAACQSDFIMIAEFSEQEGPKPLVSIFVLEGLF